MAFDENWLKSLEDKFQKETANLDSGFKTLEDAKYLMRLDKVEIAESKKGNPQVVWDYTVIEGEMTGETHKDFDGLTREDAFRWLGIKLRKFGIDITAIGGPAALPRVFAELTAAHPTVVVRLKTNTKDGNSYQNTYVEKVGDIDGGGDSDDNFRLVKGVAIVFKDGATSKTGTVLSIDSETETCVVQLSDESEVEVGFNSILGPAS